MLPPFNPHPLHSTKEIRGHPFFRGAISRWLWRLYTHRMTRPSRWFAGMTLTFALYGATSLDLQVFVPFTYAMSIWVVAWVWTALRPPRVVLTVHQPSRVEAGAVLPVTVTVQTLGRPVFDAVLLAHRLPPAIDAVALEGVALGTLHPGEAHTARLELRPARRGLYTVPGYRVQTDFPFGLLRSYTAIPDPQTVLVTPRWTPLRGMDLPLGRSEQPGGAALATARGEALEFMGSREFREGDNIRDMDWRATARLDRLVVREFHEEYLHRVALVLDTAVPDAPGAEDALESAVSLCAAAGEFLARQEYSVSLLLAGPTLHVFDAMPPWACQEQTLDILAQVAPTPSPALSLDIPGLAGRLEDVSVVFCFLLDWDEARRTFMEALASQGLALRLVLVGDNSAAQVGVGDEARFGPILRVTAAQIEHGLDHL